MGIKIYKLPAGRGKTDWAVKLALEKSAGLTGSPFVVLPSALQVEEFRSRLGSMGGSLGVNLGTFREISTEILTRSDHHPIILSEANQALLLGDVIDKIELDFYKRIETKPGFIRSALKIIRELKSGGISPEAFLSAVSQMPQNQRLAELSRIYSAYDARILAGEWIDPPGLIQAALNSIEHNPKKCPDWNCIILDGFDDLTPVQALLIGSLAEVIPGLFITITGTEQKSSRNLVHKRFIRLEETLSQVSDLEHVPSAMGQDTQKNSFFIELEQRIFEPGRNKLSVNQDCIQMLAVPDRDAEIREALRWIKNLVQNGKASYQETAIITRSLEPYRKIIHRVAAEYGMPVRILGGLPLSENPLISAIIKLLDLAESGKDGLGWESVVEIWRSPYFDWRMIGPEGEINHASGSNLKDAQEISMIARWGNVIKGYDQWEEAFHRALLGVGSGADRQNSWRLPGNDIIQTLWDKFNSFVLLIDPPASGQPMIVYLHWIEELLGDLNEDEERRKGLDVYSKVNESEETVANRDLQALESFLNVMRELAWSAEAFRFDISEFGNVLAMLKSGIDRKSYQPFGQFDQAVTCGDSREVRGLFFKAGALIGVAEGEFPATIKEDPFLRDADRVILREDSDLQLRQSTDSAETEYFYEAVTRITERMMITRPRMADNGSPWQPSPFWEEMLRCVQLSPIRKTSQSFPQMEMAGSETELFQTLSAMPEDIKNTIQSEFNDHQKEILGQIKQAQTVFHTRVGTAQTNGDMFNGGLEDLGSILETHYPDDHVWSASRLENYQSCPLQYYFSNLLGLEVLDPPLEGLDARQLGNIYHHILEELYLSMPGDFSVNHLLDRLPVIANKVFKEAPQREGFRETAWWEKTREEIISNLIKTIIVLENIDPDFQFYRAEQKFGIHGDSQPMLEIITGGGDRYFLRGYIDRVDKNQAGDLRIVDYKTSGAFGFDNTGIREGKKLQLPLYALAVEAALELGRVVEGFYFHLRSAHPSYFKLASFQNEGKRGADSAIECSVKRGWEAVSGIRSGNFRPNAPANGCPDYCPAAGFCWSYSPKQW